MNLQEHGHKPQDKLKITNKEEEIKVNGLSRKHSHFLVCVCVCVCVRERERQSERQREREYRPPSLMKAACNHATTARICSGSDAS